MAKIIISLPEELLDKVADYCKKHSYNRSELIRFALRSVIETKKKKKVDVEF
jgi:metal-responsive CopG/Arc/MetJ family transcriptional regulator